MDDQNLKIPDLKHLMETQELKVQQNQLPIKVPENKILYKVQNVEHINNVQKVEEFIPIGVQEKEKLSNEIQDLEKKPLMSIKDKFKQQEPAKEVQDVGKSLSPDNLDNSASQSSNHRSGRMIPPMPSEETMRHSIADNLMEILVNMTNPHYRQQCFDLLQVSDPLQARSRILGILQQIDEKRGIRR
ncbi:uncharacterized protein LOC108148186 [Drosophila elegans]|uniref:uncharacterized protein LOC108148186 n=1 Tax=Drosophila elegans TaxID=30023 RepID=UPI0007E898C0|nr:uncharacterized protein LOC108148186 [Drosophila elegans]